MYIWLNISTMQNNIEKYSVDGLDAQIFHEQTGIVANNHPEAYLQWLQVRLLEKVVFNLNILAGIGN